MTKAKNTVVRGRKGEACPRCGQATEVREHKAVTAKELGRPFYYARWFICVNRRCKTTMIMKEEHKVWNGGAPVIETVARPRDDVVMEVLEDMKAAGGPWWPPWEEGSMTLVFGDFWKRWHDGEWAGIDND